MHHAQCPHPHVRPSHQWNRLEQNLIRFERDLRRVPVTGIIETTPYLDELCQEIRTNLVDLDAFVGLSDGAVHV